MLPKPPHNQLVMISDRLGTTRKNFDSSTFSRIAALSNYYPETLGNILVVGANWIFHLVHKFVATFLDPVTMGKMILFSSDHNTCIKEMQQRVDKKQLLPEYGGIVVYKMQIPAATPDVLLYSETDIEKLKREEQAINNNNISAEELDLD